MAKYTISVALDETSSGHMSEEDFYEKIMHLCSRNPFTKFLKDIKYKHWTEFRFSMAMKFGTWMINTINEIENHPESYLGRRYLKYIKGKSRIEKILSGYFSTDPLTGMELVI